MRNDVDYSKHSMPSCFFAAVALVISTNKKIPPVNNVWWGHSFLSAGRLKNISSREVTIDLSAFLSGFSNNYFNVSETDMYNYIRTFYDWEISQERIFDVDEYMSMIDTELARNAVSLTPYARCQKHALLGFEQPASHYVVVVGRSGENYRIIDQENNVVVGRDKILERLAWSYAKNGFLPWFSYALDNPRSNLNDQTLEGHYLEALSSFENGGAANLDQYCADVTRIFNSSEAPVIDGELWTFPLCRKAEKLLLENFPASRFQALVGNLQSVYDQWQAVLLSIRANMTAGKSVSCQLGGQLSSAKSAEYEYFSVLKQVV